MTTYTVNVNGKNHEVKTDADTPILWVLRDNLNLVGTKYGCGMAQCGACTIHIDGSAIRSCVLPISNVGDKKLTTIEGLSEDGTHPLQNAWVEHDVPQCGYCQSGQIMNAAAFLKENSNPTDEEIVESMNGNICRCGTYTRIKAAVKTASKNL
ncbi:MAG: aerobic-type carbon monoxide dehydrogenase small subunit (CoxS/CutS family) [Saprospiraceae bacterium]|jgi:aerobic-type carbon monoxide dehydrogenase small subunit (CoxS/CutS family)|tara:strand:- start:597 stop:1055 length:459 start_codon:yes stop_codon:yes gene_type:complete